jgi:hypothetical protein
VHITPDRVVFLLPSGFAFGVGERDYHDMFVLWILFKIWWSQSAFPKMFPIMGNFSSQHIYFRFWAMDVYPVQRHVVLVEETRSTTYGPGAESSLGDLEVEDC